MTKHFVAERYKFGWHCQGDSESIADVIADLRRLLAIAISRPMLLMRTFVTDSSAALLKIIQSRLLTETDDLSFDRAVEIATSLEGAKLNAQLMKSPIALHWSREVHCVCVHQVSLKIVLFFFLQVWRASLS